MANNEAYTQRARVIHILIHALLRDLHSLWALTMPAAIATKVQIANKIRT